jgi:hydrogenase-4 component B
MIKSGFTHFGAIMDFIWLALVLLVASALIALGLNKHPKKASFIGAAGTICASIIGLYPASQVMLANATWQTAIPWVLGFDDVHLGLDPLSAFFLSIILISAAIVAIYGIEYLAHWEGKKPIGVFWFFFNLLIASLITIVIARNGLIFLIAWEAMSLTSFFLVAFEDEKKKVRRASLIYLIAANISAAFLIPFFILIDTGNVLNFDQFSSSASPLIFFLAFAGFGIKAGFLPFHIWLPEAHPAAPSNVSALMSGVMIKMGIYGLMRLVTFTAAPPFWWGGVLIFTGICSGIMGISLAMTQSNLKRLLAYSSIEHIGIIIFALGLGLIGMSQNSPLIALLGIGGALLHVFNHSLFKNLLFLGSGAIFHATGSLDVNHLGGLSKRMPQTAAFFLIGTLSISAIPALNGFLSEFMIYLAAFRGMMASSSAFYLGVILALCIIGGLTLAVFSGLFSILFLGEPRSEKARSAHEMGWPMRFSMGLTAIACILAAALFPLLLSFLSSAIGEVAKIPMEAAQGAILGEIEKPLYAIISISFAMIGIAAIFFFLKRRRLHKTPAAAAVTWDCGYIRPSPRMQYTFASFMQPLMRNFQRSAPNRSPPIFPKHESITAHEAYDPIDAFFNQYLLKKIARLSSLLRWIQHGYLNLYILYIFVTLLLLLIFKFR